MSITTPQTENVADATDTLSAKIGFVVGVDQENSAHVHVPAADTIKVYDVGPDYEVGDYINSEPEHVEALEGRPLEAWMSYVATERGWLETTHRAPNGGEI